MPVIVTCYFAGDDGKWQGSLNFTPAAGGLHTCYYQKVNDTLSIGKKTIHNRVGSRNCSMEEY